MTLAPTLTTERLTLRMPVLADFGHHAAYHASDRSAWEGGPRDQSAAWRIWASDVALWPLKGYGPFGVDDARPANTWAKSACSMLLTTPNRNSAGWSCQMPKGAASRLRLRGL